MSEKSISSGDCRAARAYLGWSQVRLSEAANVSKQTIVDFERGARTPYPNNLAAIRGALEAAGIEFLPDSGIRLRRAPGEPSS